MIGCLGAAQAPQDRLSGHAGKIRRARPDRPGPPLQPWSRVRCATPSPTSSASSTAISPRCALTSSPARKRARRTEPLVAVERLSRTHHSAGSWCRAAQRRAGWGAGATSGLEQRHGRTARPSRPSLQLLKPHSTNWTQTDSLSPPARQVGISDHAQAALGDIVYVEVPESGDAAKVCSAPWQPCTSEVFRKPSFSLAHRHTQHRTLADLSSARCPLAHTACYRITSPSHRGGQVGKGFSAVESVKAASDIYAPVCAPPPLRPPAPSPWRPAPERARRALMAARISGADVG